MENPYLMKNGNQDKPPKIKDHFQSTSQKNAIESFNEKQYTLNTSNLPNPLPENKENSRNDYFLNSRHFKFNQQNTQTGKSPKKTSRNIVQKCKSVTRVDLTGKVISSNSFNISPSPVFSENDSFCYQSKDLTKILKDSQSKKNTNFLQLKITKCESFTESEEKRKAHNIFPQNESKIKSTSSKFSEKKHVGFNTSNAENLLDSPQKKCSVKSQSPKQQVQKNIKLNKKVFQHVSKIKAPQMFGQLDIDIFEETVKKMKSYTENHIPSMANFNQEENSSGIIDRFRNNYHCLATLFKIILAKHSKDIFAVSKNKKNISEKNEKKLCDKNLFQKTIECVELCQQKMNEELNRVKNTIFSQISEIDVLKENNIIYQQERLQIRKRENEVQNRFDKISAEMISQKIKFDKQLLQSKNEFESKLEKLKSNFDKHKIVISDFTKKLQNVRSDLQLSHGFLIDQQEEIKIRLITHQKAILNEKKILNLKLLEKTSENQILKQNLENKRVEYEKCLEQMTDEVNLLKKENSLFSKNFDSKSKAEKKSTINYENHIKEVTFQLQNSESISQKHKLQNEELEKELYSKNFQLERLVSEFEEMAKLSEIQNQEIKKLQTLLKEQVSKKRESSVQNRSTEIKNHKEIDKLLNELSQSKKHSEDLLSEIQFYQNFEKKIENKFIQLNCSFENSLISGNFSKKSLYSKIESAVDSILRFREEYIDLKKLFEIKENEYQKTIYQIKLELQFHVEEHELEKKILEKKFAESQNKIQMLNDDFEGNKEILSTCQTKLEKTEKELADLTCKFLIETTQKNDLINLKNQLENEVSNLRIKTIEFERKFFNLKAKIEKLVLDKRELNVRLNEVQQLNSKIDESKNGLPEIGNFYNKKISPISDIKECPTDTFLFNQRLEDLNNIIKLLKKQLNETETKLENKEKEMFEKENYIKKINIENSTLVLNLRRLENLIEVKEKVFSNETILEKTQVDRKFEMINYQSELNLKDREQRYQYELDCLIKENKILGLTYSQNQAKIQLDFEDKVSGLQTQVSDLSEQILKIKNSKKQLQVQMEREKVEHLETVERLRNLFTNSENKHEKQTSERVLEIEKLKKIIFSYSFSSADVKINRNFDKIEEKCNKNGNELKTSLEKTVGISEKNQIQVPLEKNLKLDERELVCIKENTSLLLNFLLENANLVDRLKVQMGSLSTITTHASDEMMR